VEVSIVDLASIAKLAYVVAAILFIVGLKLMAHPRTAVRGNLLGSLAMLLAVIVTLVNVIRFEYIITGAIAGALLGGFLALRIQMTAMPQLVGAFNGFGGAASVLVAGA